MKEIKITSNGIKQAIDDLVNENKMLQDRVYKLEGALKEVREYIEEMNVWCLEFENFGVESKRLLEILDKVGDIK